MTRSGSPEWKLGEVARRLAIRESYETVDFMVLEGASLASLRHHFVAFVPDYISGAWEESVQERGDLSAFTEFDAGCEAVIYGCVQLDSRLTLNERRMAALYGLGSVLVVPLVWDGEIRGALAV